ncbi:MAG: bifunctional demethylmenaquinone methyltransferase/2-methoxy-6-polyprenyl-1,4-benzoquinol methylase UbiE [Alphaproteobacteria bacterium]
MSDTKENPESRWFGEENVEPQEKTERVHGVFSNVADKYDVMNDLMSGGVHRLWKDRLIRMIRPRQGLRYLDVAGGTGDIAFRLRRRLGAGADITLCDLTENMLAVGRDRAIDLGWLNDFRWVTGNAEDLPFEDNSFDVYTIAFGLRNVTHIDKALREAHRVLKPGGRFYCLEFSKVQNPLLSKGYDLYSTLVIPQIGAIVANDRESYQYLVESIRKHPDQKVLKSRVLDAGFEKCEYFNLSAGITCIHFAYKS